MDGTCYNNSRIIDWVQIFEHKVWGASGHRDCLSVSLNVIDCASLWRKKKVLRSVKRISKLALWTAWNLDDRKEAILSWNMLTCFL